MLSMLLSAVSTANAITAVDLVNSFRRLHDAPDVVYNETLEADAAAWARHVADVKTLQHSDARGAYGENLGVVQPYSSFVGTASWEKVVSSWYSEVALYSPSQVSFSPETGHFTQLVWKSCKSIALGMAIDYVEDKLYVVMRFYPAGNVLGQFEQNVFVGGAAETRSPSPSSSLSPPPPFAPPLPSSQPALTNMTLSCLCSNRINSL